jgi:hypothetical protein
VTKTGYYGTHKQKNDFFDIVWDYGKVGWASIQHMHTCVASPVLGEKALGIESLGWLSEKSSTRRL